LAGWDQQKFLLRELQGQLVQVTITDAFEVFLFVQSDLRAVLVLHHLCRFCLLQIFRGFNRLSLCSPSCCGALARELLAYVGIGGLKPISSRVIVVGLITRCALFILALFRVDVVTFAFATFLWTIVVFGALLIIFELLFRFCLPWRLRTLFGGFREVAALAFSGCCACGLAPRCAALAALRSTFVGVLRLF